jgi:hypothetical protein
MDFNQIRINAVLGVCARQRELIAENKKLQKKINSAKLDFTVGCIGFGIAVALFIIGILG